MSVHPSRYVVLPWRVVGGQPLPDHLHRTYELILSLAWERPDRRTPPVSRRELATLRGVSLRAMDGHLRELRRRGLVANLPGREGRKLVLVLKGLPSAEEPAPAEEIAVAEDAQPGPAAAHAPAGCHPPTPATGCASGQTPAADDGGLVEKKRVVPPDEGTQSTTLRLLLEAGVYPGIARRLALQPWVTPEVVTAWWAHLRRNQRVRAPAGVLASVLREPETCLPAPAPPAMEPALPEGWGEAELPGEDDAAHQDDAAPQEDAAPQDDGARGWVMVAPWLETLDLLRQRLGAERVDVWLAGSVPIGHQGRDVTVAVRSPVAVDWLGTRMYRAVRDALQEVTGEAHRLTFVAARAGVLRPDP